MSPYARAYLNAVIKLIFCMLLFKFGNTTGLVAALFFFGSMLVDILAMCYTILGELYKKTGAEHSKTK